MQDGRQGCHRGKGGGTRLEGVCAWRLEQEGHVCICASLLGRPSARVSRRSAPSLRCRGEVHGTACVETDALHFACGEAFCLGWISPSKLGGRFTPRRCPASRAPQSAHDPTWGNLQPGYVPSARVLYSCRPIPVPSCRRFFVII